MRDSSSVRLIWSSGRGPAWGGCGGFASRLLAGGGLLGLPLGHLGVILSLLALEAFLSPCLNLGLGHRDGHQAVFPPLDLLG